MAYVTDIPNLCSFPMSCAWAHFLTCFLQHICFGTENAKKKILGFSLSPERRAYSVSRIFFCRLFSFLLFEREFAPKQYVGMVVFRLSCISTRWMDKDSNKIHNLLLVCWLMVSKIIMCGQCEMCNGLKPTKLHENIEKLLWRRRHA